VGLALLAALAGEHLLLVGPPGTAKSLLARRLRSAIHGASYFERLLTRFSVPEELFGPLSIKGLQDDRYKRNTEGYLPTASIAFLDEIFKANSAILNSLLTILNEREFDDDGTRGTVPLVSLVGASNELPEGEELDALFDRFLIRFHVNPVSAEGFPKLLGLVTDERPVVSRDQQLSVEDLDAIRTAARSVRVAEGILDLFKALRGWLAEQKIVVSDRRWRKVLALLQVAALTNGRDEVSIWDAWLVPHCLWEKPEQLALIEDWYATRVGVGAGDEPARFPRLIAAWEKQLENDREAKGQARDRKGRLLYRDAHGQVIAEKTGPIHKRRSDGELLYVLPQNMGRSSRLVGHSRQECQQQCALNDDYFRQPTNWFMETGTFPAALEAQRYSTSHIRGRVEQLDKLLDDVDKHARGLSNQIASLSATINAHLWVPPDFSSIAGQRLDEARQTTDAWRKRLAQVRTGFESLPPELASEVDQQDDDKPDENPL